MLTNVFKYGIITNMNNIHHKFNRSRVFTNKKILKYVNSNPLFSAIAQMFYYGSNDFVIFRRLNNMVTGVIENNYDKINYIFSFKQ